MAFLDDSNDSWSKLAYWMRNAAFEQCPEALMLLDPLQNKYVDCNVAASKLLGYPREKLLQTPVSRIHGHELGQLIVFTQEVIENGFGRTTRLTCRDVKGEHLTVEIKASLTLISQRTLVVFAVHDIEKNLIEHVKHETDRISRNGILEFKHFQTIFQQGERENQLMLTSVGDGIYCVDTNGLCTFINPAAKRLLGRTDDEVIGQNIHYVHHHTKDDGSHYPVELCPIYAAIRDGVVHEGEREMFWRHNGEAFPVEFTSTPIISDSSIVGAVVVFRDISERLETEQRLKDTLDELSTLKARLEEENAYLQQEFLIEQNMHGIVGESPVIKRVLQQIELVAQTEANVLVTGESGTGKELIARAIHDASARADKPLIRVNCAAIPHELFESEFFGHVKGAFTGALRDRIGRFELANGGTLFLDEVGEIPLELQGKLLRVLQEGQLERVGEANTREVNVRIIAATNRDLKEESKNGRFREDLYFRLNVFPIHSPPLRDRGDDVRLLALHFLDQTSQKYGHDSIKLRQNDLEKMRSYAWPGNIRELQNVIGRAVITARDGRVSLDLPSELETARSQNQLISDEPASAPIFSDEEMQKRVEANMVAALEACDWKLFGEDGAAAMLNMRPTTLASRVKRLGLEKSLRK